MKQIRSAVAAFIASWGMISDYTLPKAVIAPFRMQIPSKTVLFCFPFCGALAGVLALLPALLIGSFFNRFAGALVFTLAGALLLFFKDSGRGLALLVSYVGTRFSGSPPALAFQHCDNRLSEVLKNPVVMLMTGIFVIIVLGMLFALFYRGAGFWFIAVSAADAVVQARLCLEPDRNTKIPFIRIAKGGEKYLAVSSLILALIMMCVFPKVAALGAFVVLWVWFWRELPGINEFSSGLSSDWITLGGFWAAVLTLLCGMGML
ncbi:MAG: hypothetical protein IKD44_06795 [Lentisphaeria bacterium]|nr:hypothetical protein [Lentisphaeria bacterium]